MLKFDILINLQRQSIKDERVVRWIKLDCNIEENTVVIRVLIMVLYRRWKTR